MTPGSAEHRLWSGIEDAGLNASGTAQQRWLDGWLVRTSPGKAKRARCINALAAGCRPLDDKLAEAQALFDACGLPLILRLTPFTQPPGLDADLHARGLQRFDDTCVLGAPLDAMALDEPLPPGLRAEPADAADFAAIVGAWRGSPPAQRQAHVERLRSSPVPYQALVLRDGAGQALAGGQSARDGAWVGLYDVFTSPTARNRGLARRLCAALLRQAAADGARTAYLQVDADNAPALAAYRRLGFAEGYRYHYRAADPARC